MRASFIRVLSCAAIASGLLAAGASAAAPQWTKYDRPATYKVITEKAVPVTLPDGTVLRANVYRPQAPGRFPVLLFQDPYGANGPLENTLGASSPYFPSRGYVNVVVDVRGTGQSAGNWNPFSTQERTDGYDLVEWAARLPYSDGRVGLSGPSYGGITQLMTAALRPPHLRAIMPEVPLADLYRDIVVSGGAGDNTAFIPAFVATVAAGMLQVPPGLTTDPAAAALQVAAHAMGIAGTADSIVLGPLRGNDQAFDGGYWRERSTIELVDRINVPTFLIGGLHDIFQRGTPLVYERLRGRVPVRLVMTPLKHLEPAILPRDGVPAVRQIALRWYDHWLKGIDTRVDRIPAVTQYTFGPDRFITQDDWPNPRIHPARMYLRGGKALSATAPASAEAAQSYMQQPLSGVCSLSTSQWTGGAAGDLPCTASAGTDEALGNAAYDGPPLQQDMHIDGPILANIWLRTTAREAPVTVRVFDVAPGGKLNELTDGWLSAGFRAVDPARSRFVGSQLLQPWHPFTRESVLPVVPGQAMQLPVEVFSTNAILRAGHHLRVTVNPSDFPHQVPPLGQLAGSLAGRVTVLNDPEHPSYVALPVVGDTCTRRPLRRAPGVCRPLKVPRLSVR